MAPPGQWLSRVPRGTGLVCSRCAWQPMRQCNIGMDLLACRVLRIPSGLGSAVTFEPGGCRGQW